VGDGSSTNFWEDIWISNQPLKILYPALFNISSQKSDIIANMGWFEGEIRKCTLVWERQLLYDDLQQVEDLCTMQQ